MHDAALYGQCAELLDDEFRPHGMTLRSSSNGNHTLNVVRQGATEAIEVFEVSSQGNTPFLIWVGGVVAPEGVNMNSIVALPGGDFGVSSPRSSDL